MIPSIELLPNEEWKVIAEAPRYAISNMGRLIHIETNKIRKQKIDKNGYNCFSLYVSRNVHKNRFIHQLVAKAFLPNPLNKPEVHHKEDNKNDNRAEYLEWVTTKENHEYAVKSGRVILKQVAVVNESTFHVFESISKCAIHFLKNSGQIWNRINRNQKYDGYYFVNSTHKEKIVKSLNIYISAFNGTETLNFTSLQSAADFFHADKDIIKRRLIDNKHNKYIFSHIKK